MKLDIHILAKLYSTNYKLIWLLIIAFFWMIENAIPLFNFKYNKYKHCAINIFLGIFNIFIHFLIGMCIATVVVQTNTWALNHNFGVLRVLPQVPFWLSVILGFLLLDLSHWFTHFISHKFTFIWRFHKVHHSDQQLDVSSAYRHHFGEAIIGFTISKLMLFLLCVPLKVIAVFSIFSTFCAIFNHSNIKLPSKLNKILGLFLITPDMHKVHHHYMQPYTDSNYGNMFSFWDKIFGTFRKLSADKIIYGINSNMNKNEVTHLFGIWKMPFTTFISQKNL